jgi:hypothetical protein
VFVAHGSPWIQWRRAGQFSPVCAA